MVYFVFLSGLLYFIIVVLITPFKSYIQTVLWYFEGLLWIIFSIHACVILGDFCYFCHLADDSAGGPGVSEVIYNPVAMYGMMIFWIYVNFGMASDIQYTRDNIYTFVCVCYLGCFI